MSSSLSISSPSQAIASTAFVFTDLPDEVIQKIFAHVLENQGVKAVNSLALTCKKFSVLMQDSITWHLHLNMSYPGCIHTADPLQRVKDLKLGVYKFDPFSKIGHRTLEGHNNWVLALLETSSGHLISASNDKTIVALARLVLFLSHLNQQMTKRFEK